MVESIKSGDPKGYETAQGVDKPKSDAEIKVEQLTSALEKANTENEALKQKIADLELQVNLVDK